MANIEKLDQDSIVLCDSIEVISKILDSQIENIKIYTSSPAVCLKFKDYSNIFYLEKKWNIKEHI